MVKRDQAVSDQDLDQLSGLFRLLADRTRLSILLRLSEGECNVSNLCRELHLPQPTVSHHLGLLRMNNLVGNRRHGKEVFYALNGRDESEDDKAMTFVVQNLAVHIGPRDE